MTIESYYQSTAWEAVVVARAWTLAVVCGVLSAGCGDDFAAGQPEDARPPSSDAGSEEASSADGAGPDAGDPPDAPGAGGEPIEAPLRAWTWVDFPDALCANGAPTGIGVNLVEPGAPALIFLMGGGGCWDHESCYVTKLAANVESGFGANDFAALAPALGGIFDRADLNNPFHDMHHVIVPYCTGDVHAGSAVTSHGGIATHHVGYDNLGAFLARLVPTFAGSERVVLAGTSAGGFGAIFNAQRTSLAFGSSRVDVIDDAGPWLENPYLPEELEQKLRAAWGLAETLPADCAGCASELAALFGFAAASHPASRFALLTHSEDGVIQAYMGLDAAGFEAGLTKLELSFAPYENLHYFEIGGAGHGSLSGIDANPLLAHWLTDMLGDAPDWKSIEP
jgi:hypothetical protein